MYGYISARKVLLECPSGRESVCTVSEDIYEIYPFAFAHCISGSVISRSVRVIGENAFWNANVDAVTVYRECRIAGGLGKEIEVSYYED